MALKTLIMNLTCLIKIIKNLFLFRMIFAIIKLNIILKKKIVKKNLIKSNLTQSNQIYLIYCTNYVKL